MLRKLSFHVPTMIGALCRGRPLTFSKGFLIHCLSRTYLVKSFKARENSVVRSYQNSFQLWVLNFFKNDPNYSTFDTPKVISENQCELDCLDLNTILSYLWTKKSQEALTPVLLRRIDAALAVKISPKTLPTDLLNCLHICITTVPIQAAKMESFKNAIPYLERWMMKSKLTPHYIVQTMYYCSHLKNGILAKKFMQAALHHLDEEKMKKLSTTDLGIYCVSLFRSAVPVGKQTILKCLEERFRREISTLLSCENSAIFVCFVKCFRLSKHYEEDLLGFVASQDVAKILELDFTARIHLGVWFVAAEHPDVQFVRTLLSSCAADLSSNISSNAAPRLKDLDNLLWSSASYGMSEVSESIRNGNIPDYVRDGLCMARNDPHLQISLLTWLVMCGCWLEREVAQIVTPQTITYIKDSKNFKSLANLYLLMSCAEVEAPGLLKPNILNTRDYRLQPKVPQYLEKRPLLKGLLAFLQKNNETLLLDNVRFAFQIPALYVGGIYAEYQGKALNIEVLDSTTCISTHHPKGRMALKLRLLEKLGVPVLKVDASNSQASSDLSELLTGTLYSDEINRLQRRILPFDEVFNS